MDAFGIILSQEEFEKVAFVPFGEETLWKYKDSHILFLGTPCDRENKPLTIVNFFEMLSRPTTEYCMIDYVRHQWPAEKFVNQETCELRWYLIAKDFSTKVRSKTIELPNALLEKDQEIERAIVYVYLIILMEKARGKRLFEDGWIMCKDIGPFGARILLSNAKGTGLVISDQWGHTAGDEIAGIVPSIKSGI